MVGLIVGVQTSWSAKNPYKVFGLQNCYYTVWNINMISEITEKNVQGKWCNHLIETVSEGIFTCNLNLLKGIPMVESIKLNIFRKTIQFCFTYIFSAISLEALFYK